MKKLKITSLDSRVELNETTVNLDNIQTIINKYFKIGRKICNFRIELCQKRIIITYINGIFYLSDKKQHLLNQQTILTNLLWN